MSTPNETMGDSGHEDEVGDHAADEGGGGSGGGGTLGTPSRKGVPAGEDEGMVVSGGGIADPGDD